jgi:hypothetical protein
MEPTRVAHYQKEPFDVYIGAPCGVIPNCAPWDGATRSRRGG